MTYQDLPVLITGGLGMIGSNLAHALISLGARVTIADAMLPLYGGNLFNLDGIQDQVTLHYTDIRDEHAINQLVQGQAVIFNLAAQVSYADSQTQPFLDLDINCRGHLTLLEACRKFNPEAKVIFSGSRLQYGPIEYNPVDESHSLQPLNIYGLHKWVGEQYHLFYNRVHHIPTIVFRIANPYGPRQQMRHSKYGIVNHFIKLAMTGQPIRIFGDGEQVRDYIYVNDLVNAFVLAGASNVSGEVFNVGSGDGMPFREMAKMVVEIIGKGQIEYIPWPDDYKSEKTGDYVSNISKAARMLNWIPICTLHEGIENTYRFYQEHKEHYW